MFGIYISWSISVSPALHLKLLLKQFAIKLNNRETEINPQSHCSKTVNTICAYNEVLSSVTTRIYNISSVTNDSTVLIAGDSKSRYR